MRTNSFQKVNTNDDDIELEEDIDIDTRNDVDTNLQANKSVQDNCRKVKLAILCVSFAIVLCSIAFISGYLIESWTNDDTQLSDNAPYTVIDDPHNYYIRDESCFSRKCCKAIDILDEQQQTDCATLTIKDCVLESEYCEWNCAYYRSNHSDFNHSASTTTQTPFKVHKRRHKRFYGISTGIV